jgi:hypothetical protein
VGLGPSPGAARVLGGVLYINGGGWSGRAWRRQLLLEGEVDALTGVACRVLVPNICRDASSINS